MTEDPTSNAKEDVELQLAQRIIEITKIVETNSNSVEKIKVEQDQIKETVNKWDSNLQEWELNLENRFTEVKQTLTILTEKLGEFMKNSTENIEEIEKKILRQQENQKTVNEELKNKIQDYQENQIQVNDKSKMEIEARLTTENFDSSITEIKDEFNEKTTALEQTLTNFDSKFNDHSSKTQDHFDSLANTIEMLGEGLEKLGIFGDTQATQLEEQRNSLKQFKQKLKEVISSSKEDQQKNFDNFLRLLESYKENIRTEIALTAQSLKESDTEILDEVSDSFMARKKGEELEKTLTNFIEELRSEAGKTRDELVQGLKESVEEYDKTMDQQNTRIQKYQNELKTFQNEIQAVIDRKVNEKYEVVFLLLSKVAVQTEELALLIKTSEIHIPAPISQVDQNFSQNAENKE